MSTKASLRRVPDDVKALYEARQEELRAKNKKIARYANQVFATEEGKYVLRWLMEISGYQKPDVIRNPATGEILTDALLYNAAWRTFYLNIRSILRPEILRDVENKGLEMDEGNLFE